MKRNHFITKGLILLAFVSFLLSGCGQKTTSGQYYYEVRIYKYSDPSQVERIDKYLGKALLPALHRAGIPTVGVFKPIESDTVNKNMVYVFIPYQTIDEWTALPAKLEADLVYADAGKDFIEAPFG